MGSILSILLLIANLAYYIVIAHVVMSWLINFQVLNLRQPIVAKIWMGLNRLLEPIYSKVRQFLPNLGGMDLAPLVVLVGLIAVRLVLIRNGAFAAF